MKNGHFPHTVFYLFIYFLMKELKKKNRVIFLHLKKRNDFDGSERTLLVPKELIKSQQTGHVEQGDETDRAPLTHADHAARCSEVVEACLSACLPACLTDCLLSLNHL